MASKPHAVHHELGLKVSIVLVLFLALGWVYFNSMQAPVNQNNVCLLFKDHPEWYWDASSSRSRWGVPISVQMAVIQKESHFRASVKPPYQRFFGVVPFARQSSAVGYTQALDGTWHAFLRATGRRSASREDFADAVDFIGWYVNRLQRETGVEKTDAFRLYLAYHEGPRGYLGRSYLSKPWLIHLAHQVSWRAHEYRRQLVRCRATLPKKPWWRFW
jgi:hypothetical protein